MHRFRRILLVLDPSMEPTLALDRAVELARAFNATLWLGLFDRGPRLGMLGLVARKDCERAQRLLRDQLSQRLQILCDRLNRDGLSVHATDQRERATPEQILEQVHHHRIDLVIKDVGHDSTLRRMAFLPLDWELLRGCPVPIWMVGSTSSGLPRRIVAAVDPSNPEHGAGPLNDAILSTARRLAKVGHGRVQVWTAFTGMPPMLQGLQPSAITVSASLEDLYDYLREEHRKSLSALLSRHDLGQDDAVVLSGDATRAVLEALEGRMPDVLVVGMVRRHGFDRLVMGSTVEQLVGRATCDVLAVPAISQKVAVTAPASSDERAA